MRKTVEVKRLVEHVNEKLALPTLDQHQKLALCLMLETMLHETGNYRGYNHNFNWNEDPDRVNKDYDRHYYYKG